MEELIFRGLDLEELQKPLLCLFHHLLHLLQCNTHMMIQHQHIYKFIAGIVPAGKLLLPDSKSVYV